VSKDNWKEKFSKLKERDINFSNLSKIKINPLYTPDDNKDLDYDKDLNYPGEYPYTRGVQSTMYRGRLWTMRQFSGFGTPKDTNNRYKYLLKHGQTGLSVAFDFPTLYGKDSDDPFAQGEVGKCGVAIDTLRDMEILFDGIPLEKISTSMTINPPAAMLLAMYIVVGEKQGVPKEVLTGTIQNDMLKEYQAQKTWIYPPEPSMRIITDILEYCTENVPNDYGIKAGLPVDTFAPRLSFFFNSHLDFFEEIAKYRAARRIWAKLMKDKYHAQNPKSYLVRFHTQTAGCSLTAQQPENNIIRTAFQGLAAVLGGTQSLHTNSMDETYALPTEKAVKIALRTQQLIAYETGAANTIDPLGGSYYVEALTDKLEKLTFEYFDKIETLGGVVPAIEKGFFQREISRSAYEYQKALEKKEKYHVGVNIFEEKENVEIDLLKIPEEVELDQKKSLKKVKEERNNSKVKKTLIKLREAAENGENLMPRILDCVREYATLGEMCGTLKEVFGIYKEPIIF
jgi:methylmalonyl-CoA mutase N-terminal domain/subunit